MISFILFFFLTYALLHIYVFLRLKLPRVLIPLFIFFYLSPLFWRYFDNNIKNPLAYLFILSSLLWMGFLIYLAFFTLILHFYTYFSKIISNPLGISFPTPSFKTQRILVFSLGLLFSIYSYVETLSLRVERYEIKRNKNLSKKLKIKVMHLSDVHFGPVIREEKLRLIREVWLQEKPDIVLSTGDLVDGNVKKIEHLADALRELPAPLGKYAVLGNHEFYRGVSQSLEFTERAGFTVLRGRWVELRDLVIAGVDDEACRHFKACVEPIEEDKLLENIPKGKFIILLKHRPKVKKEAIGKFDLMLSGHLHGGLYFPVGQLILKRFFVSHQGLTQIDGSYVHVSKGVGTGGPPMRFFTPPDVAIIELNL